MAKLNIPPDSEGYGAVWGDEVLATQVEGGPARYRQVFIGAPGTVPVTWKCNAAEYDTLCAFYETNKALPFQIDLIWKTSAPVERNAHFVPGTFKLASQSGQTYIVQAELEVY